MDGQNFTWAKGKQGDWLVRGPIGATGSVTVTKKSGETASATLARCVWTGDGVALYAVAPRASKKCGCTNGDCCSPCRCDAECNCRGGPIYDC